jgi:hypothetical protein
MWVFFLLSPKYLVHAFINIVGGFDLKAWSKFGTPNMVSNLQRLPDQA